MRRFDPNCDWRLMTAATQYHGLAEIRAFLQTGFGASAEREQPDVRNEFATDEWGAFEYTSRGTIGEDAVGFAASLGVPAHIAKGFIGRTFEVPVCFIFHVNSQGLIDRVNEYAAMPSPASIMGQVSS
jgi:hypothetical protein